MQNIKLTWQQTLLIVLGFVAFMSAVMLAFSFAPDIRARKETTTVAVVSACSLLSCLVVAVPLFRSQRRHVREFGRSEVVPPNRRQGLFVSVLLLVAGVGLTIVSYATSSNGIFLIWPGAIVLGAAGLVISARRHE